MLKPIFLYSCVFLSLCLAGCTQSGFRSTSSSDVYEGPLVSNTADILNAHTGGFSVTEENQETLAIDPLDAHMRARKQVKPTDRSAKRSYTTTANIPHEAGRVRLLRLEGSSIGAHHTAQTQPVKPAKKKEVNNKSSSLFSSVPKPLAKPLSVEDSKNKQQVIMAIPAMKPVRVNPQAAKEGQGVLDVRIGEYDDYIRIVMDMDAQYTYEYKKDSNDKSLIVKLPDAYWRAKKEERYSKNPYLKSYIAQNIDTEGSWVVFQFKEAISIKAVGLYKPEANKKHRLVIDVQKK